MRTNPRPFPSPKTHSGNYIDPLFAGYWRLPDLLEASPVPGTPNPRCIAINQLFIDVNHRHQNLDAFIRAMIHSRDTALKFTDAVSQGVEIKLYIEDVLRERFEETFHENHIDPDKDVLWFRAPPLEKTNNGVWAGFGKKLIPYWDERFADYDWVVVWDADIFFQPLPNTMFEKLLNLEFRNIGYIYSKVIQRSKYGDMFDSVLNRALAKTGITRQALYEMMDINDDRFTMIKPSGCLWAYPAKHFHKEHQDFIEWIRQYGPYFGDDELIADHWSHKFGLDIESLHKHLDIAINSIMYYIIANGRPIGNILHGRIDLREEAQLHNLLKI